MPVATDDGWHNRRYYRRYTNQDKYQPGRIYNGSHCRRLAHLSGQTISCSDAEDYYSLLLTSIIREPTAAEEDLEQLPKTDLRAVLLFIATTTLVIIIGSTVASIIQPYAYIDSQVLQASVGLIGITGPTGSEQPNLKRIALKGDHLAAAQATHINSRK